MTNTAPFIIDKNIAEMKRAANNPATFSFIECIASHLQSLTALINSSGFSHSSTITKNKMLSDYSLSEVILDPRITGSHYHLNDHLSNIFYFANSYINLIHFWDDWTCRLINLNTKLYLLSFVFFVNSTLDEFETIKNEAHKLADFFKGSDEEAEALLIVCKCHYFRSASNWSSKYSFWEYAAAWDIKPEWTKLIKKRYGDQLKPSDIVMQKGKTEIEMI